MIPTLKTERLQLRPFRPDDASAVQRHCGNWNVARMVARIPHPYTLGDAESWIASHPAEWLSGYGVTFCIEFDGAAVGAVGLRRDRTGERDEIGYWLGEPWWNRGITTEAARRVVRFAFEALGSERLLSGHFIDNPASGRVLEKCGFRYSGESMEHCEARDMPVAHRNFELVRAGMADRS